MDKYLTNAAHLAFSSYDACFFVGMIIISLVGSSRDTSILPTDSSKRDSSAEDSRSNDSHQ